MSKEIELKMVTSPNAIQSSLPILFERLEAKDIQENWLVNRYFDTSDLLLNRACIALRVREKGGRFIQTLKTKGETIGGLSQRGEWEWDVSEGKLDTKCLHEGGWPSDIPADGLIEVFETNFKRTSAVIELRGAKVELAVDDGYISVGGVKSPLSEVELEIIEGEVDVLFDLAATISNAMPVMLADVSKAEKGYRLRDKALSKPFLYRFECKGDYKGYVKSLVEQNMSRWLRLVDRVEDECPKKLLVDLISVLTTLREIMITYPYVDDKKIFSCKALFDAELKSLSVMLEEVIVGGGALDLERLIASGRAGVLSIELSRWLQAV